MPQHRRSPFRWMKNPISQFVTESDPVVWSVAISAFASQEEAQTAYDACAILYAKPEIHQRWIAVIQERQSALQMHKESREWRIIE